MRRGHQGLAYARQLHYLPVEGALDINIVTLLHRFESLVHRVIVKVVAHADEHRALGLQALDLRETLRKGCVECQMARVAQLLAIVKVSGAGTVQK